MDPPAATTREPDRIIFDSGVVSAGEFRCPVSHPRFTDSGATRQYCFVFPQNACWIEHEGSRPFVADSTVVPLYNQGQPYRRGVIHPAGDRTDWFGVSPAVLGEMVSILERGRSERTARLFPVSHVRAPAKLFLAQRFVFLHLRSVTPPDTFYVEEAVLTMLGEVLARGFGVIEEPAGAAAHAQQLAERARAHLNRTYLRKESVTEVATAVGVSVFHLCRVFQRETGWSLHAYRTQLRLRQSLEWLHDSEDIVSVALESGFSHHSHFTAAFTRTFGTPPSAFRARSRQHPRRRRGT
jgi:AraC-like DNA-binding protein